MKNHSVPVMQHQKMKFWLILPLLVLPFVTFLLWSVGLIGDTSQDRTNAMQGGLNFNLPSALSGEDTAWNKLQFYEKADKDSARRHDLIKNDPYLSSSASSDNEALNHYKINSELPVNNQFKLSYDPYPKNKLGSNDPNEERVYRKLTQLNTELNKTDDPSGITNQRSRNDQELAKSEASNDGQLEQLNAMMQNGQAPAGGGDPEMQQIDGMLEKILDIQHPDRLREKIKQTSQINSQNVYGVQAVGKDLRISTLQADKTPSPVLDSAEKLTTFFSLDDGAASVDHANVIKAVINESQTVLSGSTVKLELESEIFVNGLLIPKRRFLYGVCDLDGDRLRIVIKSIRYNQNILPVSLSVFDLDGQEGINIPGALTRDVAKQSTDQAIQSIRLSSLDPSIGAQAASAGIQAAKTLISRKTKLVKLTIPGPYRVLLKDNNL